MLLEFTIAGTNFVLPMNAAYALALAFILVLGAGPWFIPKLHALKFGQSIREEGPQSHQVKSGTPTMGGMMIILGLTVATLVFSPWTKEVMLALFVILGHFLLGFHKRDCSRPACRGEGGEQFFEVIFSLDPVYLIVYRHFGLFLLLVDVVGVYLGCGWACVSCVGLCLL